MSTIKRFSQFLNEEEEWIQDAIKKPGLLRRHFHKKGGEKITKTEIKDEIAELMRKDMNKEKPGAQLGRRDAKLYKRLHLAKTLMGMNEDHNEMDNYMFFANVSNMKRMCEEILEMDPSKVDALLSSGHGWATDHIATSKDDVEEVFGFLKSSMELHHDDDDMISDGEEC
jgi:hypothetical protein